MREPATPISMPHPIEQTPHVEGTQRSIDAPWSTCENEAGISDATQTVSARRLPRPTEQRWVFLDQAQLVRFSQSPCVPLEPTASHVALVVASARITDVNAPAGLH